MLDFVFLFFSPSSNYTRTLRNKTKTVSHWKGRKSLLWPLFLFFSLPLVSLQYAKKTRLLLQPAAWNLSHVVISVVTHYQFFPAGFSVNASSERLNMGEIETLDDYWAPASGLTGLPSPLCWPWLLHLRTQHLLTIYSLSLQQITEPIISGFFL